MKMGNAFLVAGLLLAATAAAARPGLGNNPSPRQVGISCRDFRLNSDGSWTPVRKVTLLTRQWAPRSHVEGAHPWAKQFSPCCA